MGGGMFGVGVVPLVGALAIGLVIGVLSGMLGIGGGTVMVPVFKLGFGMAPVVCTATSLFAIILTAISGSIGHIRGKTCVPKLGLAIGLGGAITSPLGVWLANVSPEWAIMVAATCVILYSAATMFRKALKTPSAAASSSPVPQNVSRETFSPTQRTLAASTPSPTITSTFATPAATTTSTASAHTPTASIPNENVSRETFLDKEYVHSKDINSKDFTNIQNDYHQNDHAQNDPITSKKKDDQNSHVNDDLQTASTYDEVSKNVSRETISPAQRAMASTASPLTASQNVSCETISEVSDGRPRVGRKQVLVGALIGMAAGVASGYVGIGGGFLIVPMMLQLLKMPMRLTSGTSLIAVMILAIPGVVMQATYGNVDWLIGIFMAIGTMPGAFIGARLMNRIPERTLRFLFAGFLLVAAAALILDQLHIL